LSEDGTLTITGPDHVVHEGTWSVTAGAGEASVEGGKSNPFTMEGDRLAFESWECVRSAGATPSRGPGLTPIPTPADHDTGAITDICLAETTLDSANPIVMDTTGDMVTIVFANSEAEFVCQWLPRYGDSAVVQGAGEHLAAQVSAASPLVIAPNQSWTSETGTYVWGAVAPDVAEVAVLLGDSSDRLYAQVSGGYFIRVIGPDLPCCVFTTIALDADGDELARQ
jgi:hypothetical protein